MSSNRIKLLSRLKFDNHETYSKSKLKLYKLKKIIKSTLQQDVIDGAFKKLLDVFITKNKFLKKDCLPIFKSVYRTGKIQRFDTTNIIRMFYINDIFIHRLVLRFIKVFYNFFLNDYITLYYLTRSKDKYSKQVIDLVCMTDFYKQISNDSLVNKVITHKSVSYKTLIKTQFEILMQGMKYLYRNKLKRAFYILNYIIEQQIDYKYKMIIKNFIKSDSTTTDFKFDVTDCEIDPSLICRINGYTTSSLYKALKKCSDKK